VLGTHVSNWRKLNRLTAARVAERAGISRDTLRAIEQGKGTVSTENLLRVLRIRPLRERRGPASHGRDPAQAGARLMPEREPVEVTVQIDGRDQVAGTLWIHDRGGQTASFRYADSYLTRKGSYALDPALPRSAGVFSYSGRHCDVRCLRRQRPRSLGREPDAP
jgi:transcriptional regulator with XRE-family HTH domain